MSEERNGNSEVSISSPFFSTRIAGKNFTVRDIVLLLVFGGMITVYFMIDKHADAADKTTKALLEQVKESNQANTKAQKNTVFYMCRSSCLLEQPPEKRNPVACDVICAPMKE